jgi:hypothetical protein
VRHVLLYYPLWVKEREEKLEKIEMAKDLKVAGEDSHLHAVPAGNL